MITTPIVYLVGTDECRHLRQLFSYISSDGCRNAGHLLAFVYQFTLWFLRFWRSKPRFDRGLKQWHLTLHFGMCVKSVQFCHFFKPCILKILYKWLEKMRPISKKGKNSRLAELSFFGFSNFEAEKVAKKSAESWKKLEKRISTDSSQVGGHWQREIFAAEFEAKGAIYANYLFSQPEKKTQKSHWTIQRFFNCSNHSQSKLRLKCESVLLSSF